MSFLTARGRGPAEWGLEEVPPLNRLSVVRNPQCRLEFCFSLAYVCQEGAGGMEMGD